MKTRNFQILGYAVSTAVSFAAGGGWWGGVVCYPCLEGVRLLQLAKRVCPLPARVLAVPPGGPVPCWQKHCRTCRAGAGGKHACGDTSARVFPCQEGWGWAFIGKPSVSPEHVSPTAGALRIELRLKKNNNKITGGNDTSKCPRIPWPHAAHTSGASSHLLPTAQQCQALLESGEGSAERCKPTPVSSSCCIWGQL